MKDSKALLPALHRCAYVFVALAGLAACSKSPPQSTPVVVQTWAQPIPFTAKVSPIFQVDGELRGTVRREADALEVIITSGRLEGARTHSVLRRGRMRVAVSEGNREGTWELGPSSRPMRIIPLLAPDADTLAEPLHVRIPLPRGYDLQGRWIIVEFEQPRQRDEFGRLIRSTIYAHTPQGIFDQVPDVEPDA